MVLAGRCAADAQGLGTEPPTTSRRRHTDQACDWVVTIDPENKKRNICTSQDPRRCTEKQSRARAGLRGYIVYRTFLEWRRRAEVRAAPGRLGDRTAGVLPRG